MRRRTLLLRLFFFSRTSKVYYFPDDDIMNIAHRVLVNDPTSFKTFCDFTEDIRPMLYLWTRDEAKSPDFVVAAEAEEKAVSDTSQESDQTAWAKAVKDLDGNRCVVCAIQGSRMIAVYLLPVSSTTEQFHEAEIAYAYDGRNGVTMCPTCSAEFETGSFYFNIDGTMHYSRSFLRSTLSGHPGIRKSA